MSSFSVLLERRSWDRALGQGDLVFVGLEGRVGRLFIRRGGRSPLGTLDNNCRPSPPSRNPRVVLRNEEGTPVDPLLKPACFLLPGMKHKLLTVLCEHFAHCMQLQGSLLRIMLLYIQKIKYMVLQRKPVLFR